jgi:Secretory lipase
MSLLAVVAAACGQGTAVGPAPVVDFYGIPSPLAEGTPGEIIRTERVAAPRGAVAWRVLYHSRSVQGDDIAVSGLVVAPDKTPPPGGFPVIAYAHGTTGIADRCAPSKEAVPLGSEKAPVVSLPLPSFWTSGYVVAATDYEGLGTPGRHPYLVGVSEGRGVLDSVRAARAIADAHASGPPLALGISQGGHAALFAAELAASYAPDVRLAGVVALAPASELVDAVGVAAADPSLGGFAVAVGAGLAAAYPEARLEDVFTPAALAKLDVVDRVCMQDVFTAYREPIEDIVRLDALTQAPWPRLLEENSPGRTAVGMPVFVGQGTADTIVAPKLTDALVARMCGLGDSVSYRRYADTGHGAVMESARDDVTTWLTARLVEQAHRSDCPD